MVLVDKLRGQVHQLVFNTSAFLSLGIVSLAAAGSWEHSCRSSSAVVCCSCSSATTGSSNAAAFFLVSCGGGKTSRLQESTRVKSATRP